MIKVLVIDDEQQLLEEIVENLRLSGLEAFGALDGILGLQAAKEYKPDVIVCDIMMPRLDGYGTLLAVRADPEIAHIPFLFLTAKASDIRMGMARGADDFLTKPFRHQDLIEAIHTRLEVKRLQVQTYQAEINQLQENLDEKDSLFQNYLKFVSMLSHDLKTPLTVVTSSTELLNIYGDKLTPERKSQYLRRIEKSAYYINFMLDDLQTISKVQTGHVKIQLEVIQVVPVFQELATLLLDEEQSHHTITIQGDERLSVLADRKLFRQLVMNLLTNAIKYSPTDGAITLSTYRDGERVVVMIEDNGIGIPLADQSKLFEAFYRASNVGKISGTGIGLAIIKHVVDLHHAEIEIISSENRGTTVKVYFAQYLI